MPSKWAPDPFFPAQRSWGAGRAYATDATYKRRGVHVRVEGMYGDRVDLDTRYGAEHFASVWGSASYKFTTLGLKWMPGMRAEWLTPTWKEQPERGARSRHP
jgi:hypothetical protein